MNYDAVTIRKQNVPAHLDIEKDIQTQKNGLFTFILKIANGNIADYNVVEYADIRKYLKFRLKSVVIQELTISYPLNVGDRGNPVGTNNG